MPNIHDIPTEVWHDIIESACIDGGYTGRSLALASTFFHSQSVSCRFHSLAFSSLRSLEGFIEILAHRPGTFRPNIRNLFLTFPHDGPSKLSPFAYASLTSQQRRDHDKSVQHAKPAWDERFRAALVAVLKIAAPGLRTLCIVDSDGMLPLPITPPCAFPMLSELSWMGRAHVFAFGQPSGSGLNVLPALKRVHYVRATFPICSRVHQRQVLESLAELAHSSPTHLRISAIDDADSGIPDVLARLLGVHAVDASKVHAKGSGGAYEEVAAAYGETALPPMEAELPSIRRLVLHGPSHGYYGLCGDLFAVSDWYNISAKLEYLSYAREQQNPGTRALFINNRVALDWPRRLRNDWSARMIGGPGCWVETQAEDACVVRGPVPANLFAV